MQTIFCHCGHTFRANGRVDYVTMTLRADRECPRCGGVRFVKISHDKELETVTDTGDLIVAMRPSGDGTAVTVDVKVRIHNVD